MDTQVLTRIFEPFFTTKPVGKGTGLSLSTVFGIVRAHQGWLVVESKPNEGTTFRIYFPASQHAAEKAERLPEVSLRPGRETVLVAEDEDALREMVVSVLKIQGYTVLEAASGRQALEVWERADRRIDLLLTDMIMPGGIMGRELADSLLAHLPNLKVIYTSGYTFDKIPSHIKLEEGANFLAKPYGIHDLATILAKNS